jgi:hypothetical protein
MKKFSSTILALTTSLFAGCVGVDQADGEDVSSDDDALIVLHGPVPLVTDDPTAVYICKYTSRNDSCFSFFDYYPAEGRIHDDIRGYSRRIYVGGFVTAYVCSGEDFGGSCRTLQPGFYQDGVDGFSRHIKSVSVSAIIGTLPIPN